MVGRTLKDQMAADVAATFLNASEFAESLPFRSPSRGEEGTVVMIVDVDGEGVYEQGRTSDMVASIVGTVAKASLADGGIAAPEPGDSVEWQGDWYAFEGEVIEGDAQMQKLRFVRAEPFAAGGQMAAAPGR